MESFENNGAGNSFTIVLNDALRDKRLSYKAKGILAVCLSHNKGFKFTRAWIIEHGTEGKDAVLSGLSELRRFGYLVNVKNRNPAGQIVGENYSVTDRPDPSVVASLAPAAEVAPGVRENRTPGNQHPEKPDAGKPGRNRRPLERKPLEENHLEENPPLPPRRTTRKSKPAAIELPEWLQPYREHLLIWLDNREKKHKLRPELTSSTMRALEYAKSTGTLKLYCEYAAEKNWQSLGFAGHRETIDKLGQENGVTVKAGNQGKPAMSPINYTLN
jgi:hypothetical protein